MRPGGAATHVGMLLLWRSALAVECEASHLFSQISQNEPLVLKLHYFLKMQNAMLILSQETQERIYHQGITLATNLSLLTSFLTHSLSHYALPISRAFFLCLFLSLSRSLYPT